MRNFCISVPEGGYMGASHILPNNSEVRPGATQITIDEQLALNRLR